MLYVRLTTSADTRRVLIPAKTCNLTHTAYSEPNILLQGTKLSRLVLWQHEVRGTVLGISFAGPNFPGFLSCRSTFLQSLERNIV